MATILAILGTINPKIRLFITRCLNGQNVACPLSKEIAVFGLQGVYLLGPSGSRVSLRNHQ